MNISLVPVADAVKPENLEGRIVLIIDVLRATSVITTALENGAQEILPTLEVEEALAYKDLDCLLGGERKALKIEGFHFSNSPLEYSGPAVAGRKIVLSTTNGTKAIHRSSSGERVFIGCMRNGQAAAKLLAKLAQDAVIVCSGTNGRFSLDDFICAGKIIYELLEQSGNVDMDDLAAAAYMAYRDNKQDLIAYIRLANHYNYLMSIGLEQDIEFCFTEDTTDVVPEYVADKIIPSKL